MKKIYLKPELEIERFELERMIAISTTEEEAVQGGEVLSREGIWDSSNGSDLWDDEE